MTTVGYGAGYPANPRKGKYLYRKNCLRCHKYGSEYQLGPNSKKKAEWIAIFSNENWQKIKCVGDWPKLSEKDRKDILAHMHDHAADSPAPAACR